MAYTTLDLVWIQRLLSELGYGFGSPMRFYCNNQATIHIAKNHVFHERTKHIELNSHIIRHQVVDKNNIESRNIESIHQFTDLFTSSWEVTC